MIVLLTLQVVKVQRFWCQRQGSLRGCRDPSAGCMGRIKKVGGAAGLVGGCFMSSHARLGASWDPLKSFEIIWNTRFSLNSMVHMVFPLRRKA